MTNKELLIGTTPTYHVFPDDGAKHPGLIVIHEIWGMNDHIKDVANRFAEQGYSVVAPNLFHGMSFEGKADHTILDEMKNPETKDVAQKKMRELFAPIQAPEFAKTILDQLTECTNYLLADTSVSDNVGTLGFCWGGGYALAFAAHDARVKAVVSFYGQPLAPEKIKDLACPVLSFFGEEDAALIASLPTLKEGMKEAGKDFTDVVYPKAGHAFFNDTNARMYNADAAEDAWKKTLEFLSKNLNA